LKSNALAYYIAKRFFSLTSCLEIRHILSIFSESRGIFRLPRNEDIFLSSSAVHTIVEYPITNFKFIVVKLSTYNSVDMHLMTKHVRFESWFFLCGRHSSGCLTLT